MFTSAVGLSEHHFLGVDKSQCPPYEKLLIVYYQRTLLETSANQKRHYLKSYNNINILPLDEGVRVD
jgi:hypothetical protein